MEKREGRDEGAGNRQYCVSKWLQGLFRIAPLRTLLAAVVLSACFMGPKLMADGNAVYAVQLSAVVQASPPQISLSWPADPYGAASYTVYRKSELATSWGTGVVLPGTTGNYTDTAVVAGATYEYQVVKVVNNSGASYTGYGYIYAGINAPLLESRGKLILLVATNSTLGLSNELARLQADLTGDGWEVVRHNFSSNSPLASVKAAVTNDYYTYPGSVKAVFLLGHLPVLRCGNLNVDGHGGRPMPADTFYGDIDGNWSTNTSFLPSDVELMVGRVDFSNMPGNYAPSPWPSEIELLRRYLNKDHAWRHKQINVPAQALIGNRFDATAGEAFSASGWRNFGPLVGPGNITEANAQDIAPVSQRWISLAAANTYLWSDACGAGSYTTIGFMGTNGPYYDVWSVDIVARDAKCVFGLFWGSWFGEWDSTDDIMRSALATPTMGLAACWVGRPHWYFHHMALGQPIGYSTRLSMNNSTLYSNQTNALARGVHMALMGDPTLRLHPVGPVSALSSVLAGNSVNLSWSPSSDSIVGYHVYRATNPGGPYTRRTSSLLASPTFSDLAVPANTYTYMVRAVKSQSSPSGTYYNPSQGIFTSITVPNSPFIISAQISRITSGLRITWNSQAGTSYRVLAGNTLTQANWPSVSGTIVASGSSTSWTNTNFKASQQQFYRILSP